MTHERTRVAVPVKRSVGAKQCYGGLGLITALSGQREARILS